MSDQDRTVARIAAAQHGLITWRQLLRAGIDRDGVRRRVAAGRLHRVHRGVYAVGHPGLTLDARYLAAVLACGEGAVLSHRAAAHLLRLTTGPAPLPEVTGPRERRIPGVTVHRVRRLHALDTSVLDADPLTTVPRTLLDLAAHLALGDLARACHHAHVHHRTTPTQVEAAIARTPNRPQVHRLRQALTGDDLVLSDLEAGFVALLREHGLPLPRTNVRRAEGRVDCHWAHLRLTVELDSYRYHATRHQWEDDVRRARLAGNAHRRFTWGDVFERPDALLAELAPLLVQPV